MYDDWLKQMAKYLEKEWGITHKVSNTFSLFYLYLHYYGLNPQILSGYRSQAYQDSLRKRWDRGDRAGLASRPAKISKHTSRKAMDISTTNPADAAQIAKYLGIRPGYFFTNPSKNHFDL